VNRRTPTAYSHTSMSLHKVCSAGPSISLFVLEDQGTMNHECAVLCVITHNKQPAFKRKAKVKMEIIGHK